MLTQILTYQVNQDIITALEDSVKDLSAVGVLPAYETQNELGKSLSKLSHAVVLFELPQEKHTLFSAWVKSVCPNASCIAIQQQPALTLPVSLQDYDLLLPPFTALNLYSRILHAVKLTNLLFQLEQTSQKDTHTGLYNQLYFQDRLEDELAMSERYHSPLSVMVLGLDFYQTYLDTYGLHTMTQMIKTLALSIQPCIREEDVLAKIQDDELALLLPRCNDQGVMTTAQRIADTVSRQPYIDGKIHETLKVHIGLVTIPLAFHEHLDADTVIRYARHALHNARHHGKNKVIQPFSEIKPAV
jgi:diguanylate cyclase (GGDEF)-like protein